MFQNERRPLDDNAQLGVVEAIHLAAFAGYGLPPLDLLSLQQQVKDILVIPADTGVQLLHVTNWSQTAPPPPAWPQAPRAP